MAKKGQIAKPPVSKQSKTVKSKANISQVFEEIKHDKFLISHVKDLVKADVLEVVRELFNLIKSRNEAITALQKQNQQLLLENNLLKIQQKSQTTVSQQILSEENQELKNKLSRLHQVFETVRMQRDDEKQQLAEQLSEIIKISPPGRLKAQLLALHQDFTNSQCLRDSVNVRYSQPQGNSVMRTQQVSNGQGAKGSAISKRGPSSSIQNGNSNTQNVHASKASNHSSQQHSENRNRKGKIA
jgi:hypothetical protein